MNKSQYNNEVSTDCITTNWITTYLSTRIIIYNIFLTCVRKALVVIFMAIPQEKNPSWWKHKKLTKYRTAHTGNKPEDCMKWKNGYTTNTITDFHQYTHIFFPSNLCSTIHDVRFDCCQHNSPYNGSTMIAAVELSIPPISWKKKNDHAILPKCQHF